VADINHLISLGLGSPADIEHLVLFGLNATGEVAAPIRSVIRLRAHFQRKG